MIKRKIFPIAILFIIITSCGTPMGDQVRSKNLNVFYLDGVDKEEAVAFANYWKNNGFVGEKEQFIQLDREGNNFQVKIIERAMYENEPLSVNDEALLHELARGLERKVFKQPVELIITDNTFRPLEKLNTTN